MKKYMMTILIAASVLTLTGCSFIGSSEPCWIDDPWCGDQTDDYLYFVGACSIQQRHKPASMPQACMKDARDKFNTYLGEMFTNTTKEALQEAGTNVEGPQRSQAITRKSTAFSARMISGLLPRKSFAKDTGEVNSGGIPIWNYYVHFQFGLKKMKKELPDLAKEILNDPAIKSSKHAQAQAEEIGKLAETINRKVDETLRKSKSN